MKRSTFLAAILLSCIIGCTQNEDKREEEVINLPVTFVKGYGPFGSDYASASPEHSPEDPNGAVWVKTYKPITGLPQHWKNIRRSMIWLNSRQFVFQNFQQGNIDPDFYASLQKGWKWIPDETRLSKKPIRCYIYIIWGTDQSGKLNVMIDTNNNGDFGDEKSFYPEIAGPNDLLRHYTHSYDIEYDIFRQGHVTLAHIPMVIKYLPHQPEKYRIAYSFPRYAEATIPLGDNTKTLAINVGFTSPSGEEVSELAPIDSKSKGQLIGLDKGIRIGEFLDLESTETKKRFQNLGFNEYIGMLQLKGESLGDIFSPQVGYKLNPFSGRDFSSNKLVSTENHIGKYLYIGFWATWCLPCVEELPELVDLYDKVDRKKIAFLGIVGEDRRERLTKFLKRTPVPWPQIFSDSLNRLVEAYNIKGYPSSFLVAPDGTIMGKNLRSKELEAKIREIGALK